MTEALLKGAAGGALIAVVLFIADQTRGSTAGVLLMFPVISIVSYAFIGLSHGGERVREVAIAALASLPVLAGFLAVVALLAARLPLFAALAGAMGFWCVAAGAFLVVYRG